jgi:hypothetical protein
MPRTEVIYYREETSADAQILIWLDGLPDKVQDKCVDYVGRLCSSGSELRRPVCDITEPGIWYLRPRWQDVHYRILYAFVGKNKAILLHGCTKVDRLKPRDIAIAQRKLGKYKRNPQIHTYIEEL